ncbi:UNVERIFIED_CONTAM: hypothetical protein O8I53_11550 [Campylobacter lari]
MGDIEEVRDNPLISYNDMFLISKNFYNRADRHFLQERVLLSKAKDRLLALEPIPNKDVKDSEYVND